MREKVSIVSNLWIREVQLETKGEKMGGHSHTFDHQHLLAVGSIKVHVDGTGEDKIFHAPQVILVPKDTVHWFEALTDTTLGYCIHPIRDGYRVEDIVCPTMKVTLKDFKVPELTSGGITPLINDEDKGNSELTESKKWEGCHEDDLVPLH